MGYTKKWVPPHKSIGNNLASWKGIAQDLHDNILLAGVIDNGDTGQLDIASVTTQPTNSTFAGYRVYKIDDGNTLPIVFKLEFGSGYVGLYNDAYYGMANEMRIRVTVGTETDGASNFIGDSVTFLCPQQFVPPNSNTPIYTSTLNGFSFIANNQDRGFFGYFYQVDGRGGLNAAAYGAYNTSTLSFAIQRIPDSSGVPTSNGFMVLYPNLSTADNTQNVMVNSNLMQSRAVIFAGDRTVSQPTTQISRSTLHPYQGKVAADHPYAFDDMNNVFEMNAILITRMNTLARGQEISVELAPGVTQNMIAVGRETSLSFYPSRGQDHNLLMLWE